MHLVLSYIVLCGFLGKSTGNGNVDEKYDFSFDGDRGYWREVVKQNVTPPEGYISTSMDGACVVTCQEAELRRVNEEFRRFRLWTMDHLLVDVKLSTGRQNLVVKGFTFIKGSTKSSYRYLPLAIDHFDKIRRLDPISSLYVDEEFDRLRLRIHCEMTDPCLQHVDTSVSTFNNTAIYVPYTSGISRTLENTLIAALIVLRDISPTLSVYQAFDMQSEISRDSWFDMTCAGHDPGEDRPGVPYEMSRCCTFRLGNVLRDGEETSGGSRLSRMNRAIECKKQIGDVHFLRRLAMVVAVVTLLFIPLSVTCFLSRPVPYRPLTAEWRNPCDPDDYKPETETNNHKVTKQELIRLEMRNSEIDLDEKEEKSDRENDRGEGVANGRGAINGRTKPDHQRDDHVDDDFEYALGDGPNYNKTDVRNRVYLDSDPEFHLDLHLIISFLFLCHIENRALVIIRRLVIIYLLWLLVGLVCWVYGTYYPILLDEPLMKVQGDITDGIMELIFGEHRSSVTEFYHHIFLLPLIALIGTFSSNLHLFLKKQSVAKSLYSTGCLTFFGERFPESLLSMREVRRVPKSSKIKSYEVLLCQNMAARMVNVFKHDFWRRWWRDWVLKKFDHNNYSSTAERVGKYILFCLWVLVSLVLVLVHALPLFSIWENYMRERARFCSRGKDDHGNKMSKLDRAKCIFSIFVQIVGIVMIYITVWDILICYIQLIVFVAVDLVRNSSQHIPRLILAFAILGYIKGAFWNFADKYRELKEGTIQGLRDLHWEIKEEYYFYNLASHLVFKTPPYEVIWEFNDYGEISIPRRFFYEVVNIYRPYKFYVMRMFLKLAITIAIITMLILLIIDFQILGQFNSAGQLLLTLFTVSLPLLIGAVRSPWQRKLSIRRRNLNIRAWADRISRIVAKERSKVENEDERLKRLSQLRAKQRLSSDSLDGVPPFNHKLSVRASPQASPLPYWRPTS